MEEAQPSVSLAWSDLTPTRPAVSACSSLPSLPLKSGFLLICPQACSFPAQASHRLFFPSVRGPPISTHPQTPALTPQTRGGSLLPSLVGLS